MNIELNNISKSFCEQSGKKQVLSSLSYSFSTGTLYVIKGLSGCGKSTLLNIIGTIEDKDSGEMTINGVSREEFKKREETFSFFSQGENLIPDLTLYDNLKLVSKNEEEIADLLSYFNLKSKNDKRVKELSKGEQARGGIIRVLLEDKSCLLLDEPTGNLDKKNSKKVFDLLKKRAEKSLVIVISHDFDESDSEVEVLHMKNGAFEESCSHNPTNDIYTPVSLKLDLKGTLQVALNTVKHCLLRFVLSSLSMTVFLFFGLVFLAMLLIPVEETLPPNLYYSLHDYRYVFELFFLACILFYTLAVFLLSVGTKKEGRDTELLLSLIGFKKSAVFFIDMLPLLFSTLSSLVLNAILYPSLRETINRAILKIFEVPYLQCQPFSYVEVVLALFLALILPVCFSLINSISISKGLADKMKINRE